MPRTRALLAVTLLPLSLVSVALAATPVPAEQELPGLVPPAPVPSREKDPPIARLRSLVAKEDVLARARPDRQGRLVLPSPQGDTLLTVDPLLQRQLTSILQQYAVPYGAAVVVEPSTGRVLAMAEYSAAQPGLRGLATRAAFPAASIFKIVTGAALLEAGVPPDAETCFHGGKRRLSERLLVDGERDSQCHSLATAMARSGNVVFAKLTQRHLSAEALRHAAARFRFNRPIAFPVPTEVSLASIPEDDFGLASTGAGFGDVYLSPLHGALLAAAVANGGRWQEPVLFEGVEPAPAEPFLEPQVASALTEMMEETVTSGTARRVFRERCCRVPGAVGKTGTLADRNPFRDYSWFVGFAPREAPRVAVAAVVVNEPLWRIRATWLGREALRLGLLSRPPPAPAAVSSAEPSPAGGGQEVTLQAPAEQAPPGPEAER